MKIRSTKRTYISILGLVGVLGIAGFAQSVHLKGGENTGPVATDNGVTLTSSGSLAGLGQGDVTITVTASGGTATTCTNQDGDPAPGQNPAPVTTLGTVSIPASQIRNGTLSFSVTTREPAQPSLARAAGCADDNWTRVISDVDFKAYTINVEQGGKTVLTQTYGAR